MLCKKNVLSLEASIRNIIPIYEAALFISVAVKIEESINLSASILQKSFDCIAGGLKTEIRKMVKAVQVLSKAIHTIVPQPNTIRI